MTQPLLAETHIWTQLSTKLDENAATLKEILAELKTLTARDAELSAEIGILRAQVEAEKEARLRAAEAEKEARLRADELHNEEIGRLRTSFYRLLSAGGAGTAGLIGASHAAAAAL